MVLSELFYNEKHTGKNTKAMTPNRKLKNKAKGNPTSIVINLAIMTHVLLYKNINKAGNSRPYLIIK